MRATGRTARAIALAGLALAAGGAAGCGTYVSEDQAWAPGLETSPGEERRWLPRAVKRLALAGWREKKAAERVAPSHCPSGLPGCRAAAGRIVYVERYDADGDGDAHFVILDPQGITLPGITVIDVHKGLRPRPLPGPGELVSAAGPVQIGSYGQRQIHALELHVAAK